jgi:hypothetical protein
MEAWVLKEGATWTRVAQQVFRMEEISKDMVFVSCSRNHWKVIRNTSAGCVVMDSNLVQKVQGKIRKSKSFFRNDSKRSYLFPPGLKS